MPEESFRSLSLDKFLDALSAKSPTPGGGAAAGVVGATAAALAGMVVSYSLGKKNLAAHEPALRDADARLTRARQLMLDLADEDAAAYGEVNELSRLPDTDPRRASLPAAQRASVQVPLAMLAAAADLLRLMESLAPITNRHLRSDLGIAAVLCDAAARSALWNIRVNVEGLPTDERQGTLTEAATIVTAGAQRAARVESACAAP